MQPVLLFLRGRARGRVGVDIDVGRQEVFDQLGRHHCARTNSGTSRTRTHTDSVCKLSSFGGEVNGIGDIDNR